MRKQCSQFDNSMVTHLQGLSVAALLQRLMWLVSIRIPDPSPPPTHKTQDNACAGACCSCDADCKQQTASVQQNVVCLCRREDCWCTMQRMCIREPAKPHKDPHSLAPSLHCVCCWVASAFWYLVAAIVVEVLCSIMIVWCAHLTLEQFGAHKF
jgi:hypothetical protein